MSKRKSLTDDMVSTLISEVKSRTCIWNAEDEDYNDRFQVLSAWKEISKAMDIPEDVLKTKWKNLRDLFKREVRKTRAKTFEAYHGKWRHFSALWFLHRPEFVREEDNEDPFEDEYETANHFVKFEPPDHVNGVESFLDDDPIDPIPEKKRKYDDDDYDMMYLQSLTPYFRQLESIRKLVVRSKIQDMLMNEIAAQNATNKSNFKKS